MTVLVASIPHTGTFFVVDGLFHMYNRKSIKAESSEDTCHVCHFNEPGAELIPEMMDKFLTIIPKRNYEAVVDSWNRRGLPLKELEDLWPKVFSISHPNVIVLDIDSPDRDEVLSKISQRINIKLETTWNRINTLGVV